MTTLIRLYESDGITPDFMMEQDIIQSVPSTFYTKLAESHTSQMSSQTSKPIPGWKVCHHKITILPRRIDTRFSCNGTQGSGDRYIILDQTAFYPRGGGQEPDTGEIEESRL